jgi:hypothetical protein
MDDRTAPACLGVPRRRLLLDAGAGFAGLALAGLLEKDGFFASAAGPADRRPLAPKPAHRKGAKACIFLYMYGGPSQMDLFDYKPELQKRDGQPLAPPVWRGGYLVLEFQVWSEKAYSGGMAYSYSTADRIRARLKALSALLRLMDARLFYGVDEASRAEWHGFVSRERLPFPQGFRVVTYQKKLEFEIPQAVAEEMMAFLAPHLSA